MFDAADERGEQQVRWLRPLPQIETVAAGVGHVNISTESDGTARELLVRKMDNDGSALWSIAVEAVRVGDGARAGEVRDLPGAVRLGGRTLLLANDESKLNVTTETANGPVVNFRAGRMVIDYIGPTGSFAPRTYSFADVLDGKVGPERFRGKYVLVGATAATLGDQVASPFVHRDEADGNQHGTLMPGVEVLANAVNTILRERFYRETPDWLATVFAALVAVAAIFALTVAQGHYETLKQLSALVGMVMVILAVCYFAFTRWLIIPPLVSSLVSLATAAPLVLLRRSLATSADLDERIAELSLTDKWLASSAREPLQNEEARSSPATLIANLMEADAVSIFARKRAANTFQLVAATGAPASLSLSKKELLKASPLPVRAGSRYMAAAQAEEDGSSEFSFDGAGPQDRLQRPLTIRLGKFHEPSGVSVC